MLSSRLQSELNEQIKHELFSAHYYLAMAAYCADLQFDGFVNFFKMQAEEERFHAMKFFDFVDEMGGRVNILGLDQPENVFASLEDVFQKALDHERFVTSRIYQLMDIANEEKEHSTISFLKWFIDEQREEENMMAGILKQIKRLGEGPGMYHLDKELAQRTFTPPPAGQE